MKPPAYSTSMSFHRIFSPQTDVLRVWRQRLPAIRPCYALSTASTHQTIAFMREHRIPMLCETSGQSNAVNDYTLTIEHKRFGGNEYIARKIRETRKNDGRVQEWSAPYWVYTRISHDGVEHSRKMFENIWAHKHILKGIVFDIHNFSSLSRGSLPASIYSYKIALEYVLRNMVRPFERDYGITTPCIMMDGRRHITRIEHLEELRACIEPVISVSTGTGTGRGTTIDFQLIVDDLFDRWLPTA